MKSNKPKDEGISRIASDKDNLNYEKKMKKIDKRLEKETLKENIQNDKKTLKDSKKIDKKTLKENEKNDKKTLKESKTNDKKTLKESKKNKKTTLFYEELIDNEEVVTVECCIKTSDKSRNDLSLHRESKTSGSPSPFGFYSGVELKAEFEKMICRERESYLENGYATFTNENVMEQIEITQAAIDFEMMSNFADFLINN